MNHHHHTQQQKAGEQQLSEPEDMEMEGENCNRSNRLLEQLWKMGSNNVVLPSVNKACS